MGTKAEVQIAVAISYCIVLSSVHCNGDSLTERIVSYCAYPYYWCTEIPRWVNSFRAELATWAKRCPYPV